MFGDDCGFGGFFLFTKRALTKKRGPPFLSFQTVRCRFFRFTAEKNRQNGARVGAFVTEDGAYANAEGLCGANMADSPPPHKKKTSN